MNSRRTPAWLPQGQPQQALAIFGIVAFVAALVIAPLAASGDGDRGFSDLRRGSAVDARLEKTLQNAPTPPTVPATPSTPAPPPSTTPSEPEAKPPVIRNIGQTGTDEGIDFTVKSVRDAKRVSRDRYSNSGTITPPRGGSLFVAEVMFHNGTGAPVDPFCGSGSARVVDDEGRPHEAVRYLFEIAGNDAICGGSGTPIDSDATVTLVFRLPRGVQAESLELWNGKTDDFDGSGSLVRFRLR